MALVKVSQKFVMEGHEKYRKMFTRSTNVKPITILSSVEAICDELEAVEVIERKIEERVEGEENCSSYRKCCKPREYGYRNGTEFELCMEYIRDWPMKKIIKELDPNQFAILCKELEITPIEAISNA